VTASNDGTAQVWSATSGNFLKTLAVSGRAPVFNANFSHDGRLLVTCSGFRAAIWSTATGQELTEFQYGNTLSDCEFNENGTEVVTAGGDGNTRVFSTELAGGLGRIERIARDRVTSQLTPAERKEYLAGTS
jgi:WD40 repeat protein